MCYTYLNILCINICLYLLMPMYILNSMHTFTFYIHISYDITLVCLCNPPAFCGSIHSVFPEDYFTFPSLALNSMSCSSSSPSADGIASNFTEKIKAALGSLTTPAPISCQHHQPLCGACHPLPVTWRWRAWILPPRAASALLCQDPLLLAAQR